jgi:hypothetical protein
MTARTQITMEPTLRRRAHDRAAELGISFAEYVRRIVMRDLGEEQGRADVSMVFDLVQDGPETDIARDKDRMVGEAVSYEHARKTKRGRALGRGQPGGRRSG